MECKQAEFLVEQRIDAGRVHNFALVRDGQVRDVECDPCQQQRGHPIRQFFRHTHLDVVFHGPLVSLAGGGRTDSAGAAEDDGHAVFEVLDHGVDFEAVTKSLNQPVGCVSLYS